MGTKGQIAWNKTVFNDEELKHLYVDQLLKVELISCRAALKAVVEGWW